MILCILEKKPHLDETNISLDWQIANISEVSLEPSVQPQRITSLDFWYKSEYYLDIQ